MTNRDNTDKLDKLDKNKKSSWIHVLATIPLSVALTWLVTVGSYRERIDTMHKVLDRYELRLDAQDQAVRADKIDTWREIASIKERIAVIKAQAPASQDRLARLERQLEIQAETLAAIREDIASLR